MYRMSNHCCFWRERLPVIRAGGLRASVNGTRNITHEFKQLIDMDVNWIREWYDRNPVDAVLVVSFSLLLIFGWGQMSSTPGHE